MDKTLSYSIVLLSWKINANFKGVLRKFSQVFDKLHGRLRGILDPFSDYRFHINW